jgi:hypothetical protein
VATLINFCAVCTHTLIIDLPSKVWWGVHHCLQAPEFDQRQV